MMQSGNENSIEVDRKVTYLRRELNNKEVKKNIYLFYSLILNDFYLNAGRVHRIWRFRNKLIIYIL